MRRASTEFDKGERQRHSQSPRGLLRSDRAPSDRATREEARSRSPTELGQYPTTHRPTTHHAPEPSYHGSSPRTPSQVPQVLRQGRDPIMMKKRLGALLVGLVEDQVEPQVKLEDLFIWRKMKVTADRPRVHPLVQQQVDEEQVHRIPKRMQVIEVPPLLAVHPLVDSQVKEQLVRTRLRRRRCRRWSSSPTTSRSFTQRFPLPKYAEHRPPSPSFDEDRPQSTAPIPIARSGRSRSPTLVSQFVVVHKVAFHHLS